MLPLAKPDSVLSFNDCSTSTFQGNQPTLDLNYSFAPSKELALITFKTCPELVEKVRQVKSNITFFQGDALCGILAKQASDFFKTIGQLQATNLPIPVYDTSFQTLLVTLKTLGYMKSEEIEEVQKTVQTHLHIVEYETQTSKTQNAQQALFLASCYHNEFKKIGLSTYGNNALHWLALAQKYSNAQSLKSSIDIDRFFQGLQELTLTTTSPIFDSEDLLKAIAKSESIISFSFSSYGNIPKPPVFEKVRGILEKVSSITHFSLHIPPKQNAKQIIETLLPTENKNLKTVTISAPLTESQTSELKIFLETRGLQSPITPLPFNSYPTPRSGQPEVHG